MAVVARLAKYLGCRQIMVNDGGVRDGLLLSMIEELDGVTLDLGKWWCNVRMSNTEPLLRLNLEGPDRKTVDARVDEIASRLPSALVDPRGWPSCSKRPVSRSQKAWPQSPRLLSALTAAGNRSSASSANTTPFPASRKKRLP